MKKIWLTIGLILTMALFAGCSREFVGGAAVGAGGAGAAYEYQNKEALEQLEEDFEEGRIDKEEYLRRKKEIEEQSVVY
ncbi:MAG TPA: hypothetical protein VJ882_03100 [Desulfuromonadales bacterium]|nr:hypothetical protein [Desulfuromonadales bacterium]